MLQSSKHKQYKLNTVVTGYTQRLCVVHTYLYWCDQTKYSSESTEELNDDANNLRGRGRGRARCGGCCEGGSAHQRVFPIIPCDVDSPQAWWISRWLWFCSFSTLDFHWVFFDLLHLDYCIFTVCKCRIYRHSILYNILYLRYVQYPIFSPKWIELKVWLCPKWPFTQNELLQLKIQDAGKRDRRKQFKVLRFFYLDTAFWKRGARVRDTKNRVKDVHPMPHRRIMKEVHSVKPSGPQEHM